MKINPNLDPQASQAAGAASASSAPQSAKPQSQSVKTGSSDKADLSSDAQQFAALSTQASNVPDVRQDRVASLKSAIQNGSYSVSNQQIASARVKDFGTGA